MEGLLQYGQAAWQPGRTSTGPAEYPSNGLMSKTQASSPFKGGEPAVHHERAVRALERFGILCYDVAKPMKECGCQETVFTNSLVGTKTGGRPTPPEVNRSGFRSIWSALVPFKRRDYPLVFHIIGRNDELVK